MRPGRIAFQRLALVCVSILGTLLAFELLLPLLGVLEPRPPLYPGDRVGAQAPSVDPLIGWKLPPGRTIAETTPEYSVTYRSNRQGFRSRRDFSRPTRKRRVVLLGDSYTMGSGVEDDEVFAYLLERKLRKTQTYNLGIGGFGVDQMWLTLRHYGLELDPDLVILTFVRNDLPRALSAYRMGHDWLEKPVFRLVDGELEPMTLENRPGALTRFVQRRSRLVELGRRLEFSLSRRFAVGATWMLNRALFERIRDDCEAAGVPLVAVYLPINRRRPAPVYRRELAELDIPLLDLSSRLPDDADRLYYPVDGHLNAAGHRFVADVLAKFLIEGGYAQGTRGRGGSESRPGSARTDIAPGTG